MVRRVTINIDMMHGLKREANFPKSSFREKLEPKRVSQWASYLSKNKKVCLTGLCNHQSAFTPEKDR